METLDRLADAIVSVEYYMETLAGRARRSVGYMLDNAQIESLLNRIARATP
jgi:hypothetical protein